jgi:sec-independent protein translocase protein TatA
MELFTPGHLLVLAIVVAVLFFGWKQLPDMARSLGRSLRIFKTEIKGMSEDDKKRAEAREAATREPAAPPALETKPAEAPLSGSDSSAAQPPVPPVPPVPTAQPEPTREAAPVTKPYE